MSGFLFVPVERVMKNPHWCFLIVSCCRFRWKHWRYWKKETGVWTEPHPSEKAKNLCAVSVGSPAGCYAHHPGSGSHYFTRPFFLQTAKCWATEWVVFLYFYKWVLCMLCGTRHLNDELVWACRSWAVTWSDSLVVANHEDLMCFWWHFLSNQ